MTIRFAAARTRDGAALSRVLTAPAANDAANDNGAALGRDALLRAALRHFAEHGLGAADHARAAAEAAFFSGDRESYQRWLEICRTLDRRMAAAVAARRRPCGAGRAP
ncbi:MAG: hypothetical protein JF593_08960 [Novosphingobium sp.]|nr:hypothetical protein [Novosphingobium sp.]